MIDVRGLRRCNDLFIRCVRAPVADVLHDRAVVEPRILQHHREHLAQVVPGEGADVAPVHQDRAVVHVVEAHQQLDHRGLACPRRPDDGDLLTGFGLRAEVVDDDFVGHIPKVDILEFDVTIHLLQFDRLGGFHDLLRLRQELEDALRRRRRLLQHVGDVGKLRDRLCERADVLDECLDVAHGDGVACGQPPTDDGDGDVAQVADKRHQRHHQPRQELRFPGRFVERDVGFVEPGDTLGLAVERLHHDVPAIHLLDVAVDVAQVVLLLFEIHL